MASRILGWETDSEPTDVRKTELFDIPSAHQREINPRKSKHDSALRLSDGLASNLSHGSTAENNMSIDLQFQTPQPGALPITMKPTLMARAHPARRSGKRTRRHVTFHCDASRAEGVRLVGDFNGWNLSATPMRRMPDGRWLASLELDHGLHGYLFLVDGELQLDPKATGIACDDQSNRVSLIAIN